MLRNLLRWAPTHRVPVAATVVVLAAAVVLGLLLVPDRTGGAAAKASAIAVDPELRGSVAQVESLGGHERSVGVLAHPDGTLEELVLDEVMLYAANEEELGVFLQRWQGEVLDSFPPDPEGGQDHLVRVRLDELDPGGAGAGEYWHRGGYRVSDERLHRLLALVATESSAGVELLVNPLLGPQGIGDGQIREASDTPGHDPAEPENAFEWSYLREGGALDIGVTRAWQLLQTEQRLQRQVRLMVVDSGFARNRDLPPEVSSHDVGWGVANKQSCGGASCPWHGTHAVLAAAASVDNGFGVAGPGGPVTSSLIAVHRSYDYWSTLRRATRAAGADRPDIVNLSFSRVVHGDSRHAMTWTDRRMKEIRDSGALVLAAAGNEGEAVDATTDPVHLPCQSEYTMCVGGLNRSAEIASDSNRGRRFGVRSVEIYAPMCLLSLHDPKQAATDGRTAWHCGTSYASPFVAGVAALALAADPELSPAQLRQLLLDTAHADVDDQGVIRVRRVNAKAAVAKALTTPPTVLIDAPRDGAEPSVGQWLDLRGSAVDTLGQELPLSWHSDRTGALGEGAEASVPPLPAGRHVITASATDGFGRTGEARVTIEVVDTPPVVHIVSPPAAGPAILEGSDLELVATTYDPDTFAPVPEEQTHWYVWREGEPVTVAGGHRTTLPAAQLTPGGYRARFLAGGVSVEREFTVVGLPPGQQLPQASITVPSAGAELGALGGAPVSVSFSGAGSDGSGEAVPATRFRWVAYGASSQRVLCEGSAVPGAGPPTGGFTTGDDCGSFQVALGLEPGVAETTWVVWLEVYHDPGSPTPVTASVNVVVRLVTA